MKSERSGEEKLYDSIFERNAMPEKPSENDELREAVSRYLASTLFPLFESAKLTPEQEKAIRDKALMLGLAAGARQRKKPNA